MIISGPEGHKTDPYKEHLVDRPQFNQAATKVSGLQNTQAHHANDEKRQIRHHVPEVPDTENRAMIGEVMIIRVLWDRVDQKSYHDGREREQKQKPRSVFQCYKHLRISSTLKNSSITRAGERDSDAYTKIPRTESEHMPAQAIF